MRIRYLNHPMENQEILNPSLWIVRQPNCIFYGPTGSTHGTGYTYDTHVPFLIMGAGVSVGSSHEIIHITDVVDKVAEKANLPYAPNSLIH